MNKLEYMTNSQLTSYRNHHMKRASLLCDAFIRAGLGRETAADTWERFDPELPYSPDLHANNLRREWVELSNEHTAISYEYLQRGFKSWETLPRGGARVARSLETQRLDEMESL